MKKQKNCDLWMISLAIILTFIFVALINPAFAQNTKPNQNEIGLAGPYTVGSTSAVAATVPNKIKKAVLIPVGAFTSDGEDPTGYFKTFSGGYMTGNVDSGCCVVAPVIFPNGAKTIQYVYVYAYDSNSSQYEWFDFYRINPATGESTLLGQVTTNDSAGIVEYQIPISDVTLNNNYVYQLATCLRTGINVYGAKVLYK